MRLYNVTLHVKPGLEERHVMERIDYIVLARSKRDALDHVSEKWVEWRRLNPSNYRIFMVLACEMVKPDVQGAWEITHSRYTQSEYDTVNWVGVALQDALSELEENTDECQVAHLSDGVKQKEPLKRAMGTIYTDSENREMIIGDDY